MTIFEFHGRNKQGTAINGKRGALSAEHVATQLLSEGITPISIQKQEKKSLQLKFNTASFLSQKIKSADLLLFSRQMYTLVKAGIPLLSALNRLVTSLHNPLMINILQTIVTHISAGQTLSQALQHHPQIFPPIYVGMIRVGENSGHLEQAFLQVANYLELEDNTFKRFKTVMRYPLIVIGVICFALIIINIFVIPAFSQIFTQFNTPLPLPTRIILGISNFLLQHGYVILLVIGILLIGFRYYRNTPNGKIQYGHMLMRLPLTGNIVKRILLTRFARSFVMMLQAGIPMAECIGLSGEAIGNAYATQQILLMQTLLLRGESLSQSAQETKLFSPLVLQMIMVGEESGSIEEMFNESAEYYEREVDYDLKQLGDMMEPVLLAFIGAMVLVLALGVFLPMWNMVKLVHGG